MKIVKEWLAEFVQLPALVSDEEIARRLSLSTVEVEGISSGAEKKGWDAIVLGTIREVAPHPNADRLRIAHTDIGKKELCHIVCGGSNLVAGMNVAVALPGAKVRWHGEGDLVTLEKTFIRGVDSDGMICASSEIGLADQFPAQEEREILDLSLYESSPGTPLSTLFEQDARVFEIDNKSLSHRPDLWGHRGIAREVAALFRVPFLDSAGKKIKTGTLHSLSVVVKDAVLCPRYMGVVIDGVSAIPSPPWMQKRLRLAGVRPINALVDVTNYVMLECGQPMHAFDFSRVVQGKKAKIVVRRAHEGETLPALDGVTYACPPDTLVIADHEKPLALAGVIGGQGSAVADTTTTIILEAANFNGTSIRQTATSLRIATESSRRFEKSLDPELPHRALMRAVDLICSLFPHARVTSPVADIVKKQSAPKSLRIEINDIARILGIAVATARALDILKRLGFEVSKKNGALVVTIPSFRRKDITLVEDIAEEIARFVGYDTIPSVLPIVPMREPVLDVRLDVVASLKRMLAFQYGFHEAQLYAFSRRETVSSCGLRESDHLELANPISDERPLLCRSLIPNLLEALAHNQQKEKTVALFEIARVFLKERTISDLPDQPTHLACAYMSKESGNSFAYVRESMVGATKTLGYALDSKPSSKRHTLYTPKRTIDFYCNGSIVGMLGEVSLKTRTAFGIDDAVIVCEFDLSTLSRLNKVNSVYRPMVPFPSVRRDLTIVVANEAPYVEIETCIQTAHPLLVSVEPFDIYRSDSALGADKKSLSFHLLYQACDRTLNGKEVDEAHAHVIEILEKKWDAKIR